MTSFPGRNILANVGDDLKKSSEIRFLLVQLPTTRVFTVEPDDSDARTALTDFKTEYSTAKGVDQQLTVVTKLISRFTSSSPWILSDDILCQMLTDLYFNAHTKHPLRNILTKALHKESVNKNDLIVRCMSATIIESNDKLQKTLLESNECHVDEIHTFVASLNGCFENFSAAVAAVRSCFPVLMKSIHHFIACFCSLLQDKEKLSPARRSQVYIALHNSVRLFLSSVQQFREQFTDPTAMEPILSQCWHDLLEKPAFADALIDTKINSAVLKVNYDRLVGNVFAAREKILTQFELNENRDTSVLPKGTFYAIGVVVTMVETDLEDDNFFPALKVIVERLTTVGKEFTIDSCLIMVVTRALVQCSRRISMLIKKCEQLSSVNVEYLREAMRHCLNFVWINVHHSVDFIRYLSKDLLKILLRLGKDHSQQFGEIVDETIAITKSSNTNDALVCFLLDYLCQVFTTEFVLDEMPNIQQRILSNLFNDICWANCYGQLMSKNSEIDHEKWCLRWIQPLMRFDASQWKNDFDRLKIIRNLFERALKAKPETAEYILSDDKISIEIYLFVLWIMRQSGRKMYSPENYRASADPKMIYAKVHPSDEIRILVFRILIACHKTTAAFPEEDLNEMLEFLKYNCNAQNPSVRQQINSAMERAMVRFECGYLAAKRSPSDENNKLCSTYRTFFQNLIEFCVDWCLFDGSNFGRRAVGLRTILQSIETWQKILPDDRSIYTDKLWHRLQKTLSDSYVVNKDVASDILLICWKFYPQKTGIIYTLSELKKLITIFRPYDVMTAAHYLVFCAFSQTYFENYFEAVIWCENLVDDGLAMAKKSLLQTARYNSLYGLLLGIRQLLKRIDFSHISEPQEVDQWRAFFQRMISKCKELTDIAAPVVNSSAPEGHLPNDLNDVSHYLDVPDAEILSGSQIKVTAQMILLCSWRTVRELAHLLGEISLRIPVQTATNPNGLISVNQLLETGAHFQQLLLETKHRGAFEQSFLGFQNLCLRLWRSHEPQLHSYPMKLVEKIAGIISGERTTDDDLDVKKLCATRRSAGIPFMVQGVVTTESQVHSTTALTFCMNTFLDIAKTGRVEESRTHSLNILRALYKCAELGDAVSEYIADGIECSIRGYSAPSWPERNSSTLLFSALMIRVFGVQRTKESDNMSIKNKMTGRLFFIRYPQLYEFFYVELKSASEAIERNERPPRLHPLLLLITRLYPSAREGTDSNLKLSTYIPFISTCSSSPELVTRQLSAKSMVALIPSANIGERLFFILNEINETTPINAVHGFLLQILYLLRSTKQQHCGIDVDNLREFTHKFVQLNLNENNIIGRTFFEILLEILLIDRFYPINAHLTQQLIEVRDKFIQRTSKFKEYGKLTQSYVQKSFTLFNLLLSVQLESDESETNELPIVSFVNSNTQTELIETQLNIKYLLLSHSMKKSISTHDFSCYELELVEFISRNSKSSENISKLLPSIANLYHVIEQKQAFYPFGVIKAYEILSLIISTSECKTEIKQHTIGDLMEMMALTSDEEGVDDVAEAMWKFISAHLKHCRVHPSHVTIEQIKTIVAHLKLNTQAHKSSGLRQTTAEVFSIVTPYFEQSSDLELLIEISELLLSLLRDDDAYVRNQTSEIVMDLIHSGKCSEKVIPLAAEDHLLQWLDTKFIDLAKENASQKWMDLLRLIYAPLKENAAKNIDSNEDSQLIDVDIFDDTEPNTFDETAYTCHKCYVFLIKHIDATELDSSHKDTILAEFSSLRNL